MNTLLRIALDLCIKLGLLWLFTAMGWITVRPKEITTFIGLAIAFVLISFVGFLPLVFAKSVFSKLLVTIVAMATVGYASLWLLDRFAEEFFQLNKGFWLTWVMGVLLLLGVRWAREKQTDHTALVNAIKK